jgi:glycosyltransferase involved in cell wall biosynthesis/GT2 family glycosyltransferase
MKIAIVDLLGSPYDGSTLSKRGLGGSESAVISIARQMSKLGHEVVVYCDCESMDAEPGSYEFVEYCDKSWLSPIGVNNCREYDVVIGSRSTRVFTDYNIVGKLNVLWMHDTFCDGDDQLERLVVNGNIDEVWTLSDWHTTYISQCFHGSHRRMMEVLKRKIWVTRNGINLYDVSGVTRHSNRFVFNAAVNKGMKTLLEDIWPRVRAEYQTAELIVIGGAYPLKNADVQNEELKQLIEQHDFQDGVRFTGLIDQEKVAKTLASASYMIYPQSLPETFGISTVESLAYGTPVITGRFGAMEETALDDACWLMDYPVDSNSLYNFNKEAHVNAFVNLVAQAYSNRYLNLQKSSKGKIVREVCTWDKVALQWEQHLFKKLGLYLSPTKYNEVQWINHRTHEIFNKRWSNPEEWGFYPESEKPIHVIVPFFNASQYLSKCVESIKSQNYENYRVWLVDDASEDDPSKVLGEIVKEGDYRWNIIQNDTNVGALENQMDVIQRYSYIPPNEGIWMLVDGDDALANDPNIFKKINRLYHNGAQMTYGSCHSMADKIDLIADEYPDEVKKNKSYRSYHFPWKMPYSHLRTFSARLANKMDDDKLRDENGHYFNAGGDLALFYALAEQCEPDEIVCVRDVLYLYNDLNPNNDYKVHAEEQNKNVAKIIHPTPVEKKPPAPGLIKCLQMHYEATKPKKILIAIPTAQNIHAETFKSIYDLEVPKGYEVDFQYFYGYNVDQVRNLIADWVVKGFDYLFAVDYDMSFPPDTLKRLLSHNKDIVSGLYRQRNDDLVLEIYRNNNKGGQDNVRFTDLYLNGEGNWLERVDGCGFGCVLVKKQVFERVGYPYFKYHSALTMEETISEDIDFCRKATAAGFEIYCDTDVICNHHGQTIFKVPV